MFIDQENRDNRKLRRRSTPL